MDLTVALWGGGILITVIGGLIGWVKSTTDKKIEKNEKDSEDNKLAAAAMKVEIANIKDKQSGHGDELKELAKANLKLSEAIAELAKSNARFEVWTDSLDDKLENALMKAIEAARKESASELEKHIRDCKSKK